ncbi:MAG: dienelactone hydrolase family protein [Hyphomonadaceae bacterium]|nr:dienelactone hydrolase family protein [Hyphomonadaceae bacterium]
MSTLQHHAERLAPHFDVTLPDGPGRFPVLVMLHGCGGMRAFQRAIADVAVKAGAAAVAVDSYAPRRISRVAALASVCTGARLRGPERAGDLFATMHWLRQQSWAAHDRVAAIGWSHGSWTIMDALALRSGAEMERLTKLSALPHEPLEGLKAALLVYPYASFGSFCGRRDWRFNPHATAIIADQDYIVGPTRAALERQAGRCGMKLVTFENTTHAFEDEHAEDLRVRFNPLATAREHAMIAEMIEAL